MKGNTGQSHPLVSGNVIATAKIDNNYTESEKEQMLLGKTVDFNLTFEDYINNICKRESQKLKKMNNYETFCNVSIWVLSVNLDVS